MTLTRCAWCLLALCWPLGGCSDGAGAGYSPLPAEDVGSETEEDIVDEPEEGAHPALTFYEPDVIQEIALTIAPEDREAMFDALPERIYVPASFTWRDQTLDGVAVRFKGNSSSNPGAMHKRSFLIKIDEFDNDKRFMGLRAVALDNAVQFGFVYSERMISDILRAEGVTVSRSNYARLTINGEFEGLFVNVERIDKAFLEHNIGNRDGVLYKVHEGGPGADLAVLDNPDDYARTFEPKTHKADADFGILQAFARLLRDTPDDELAAALEGRFDLEPFLKLMAVAAFSGAFDQYTGWNPHNYYLYDDPETGRWTYLVWDLDVGFADNAFGQVPVIEGWNASYPLPRQPRPLLARILAHPTLRARYRAHAERILETHFQPTQIHARLDTLHTQVSPLLAEDPYPTRRITNPEDTDAQSIITSMKAFMTRRYERARDELDNPIDTPPEPPDPPMNDQPEPSDESGPEDPSDLAVVGADRFGVSLRWTDNADGEAGTILQRCEGAGCDNFRNHIGQPGDDITEAMDPGVRSGRVYRYRVYSIFPTPQGPRGTGVSNEVEAQVP